MRRHSRTGSRGAPYCRDLQTAGRVSTLLVYGEAFLHATRAAGIPEVVHAVKRRLAAMCGPRLVKLCLFGSRSRGDHSPNSDIDVAAVIRGLDRREKMAVLDAVAQIEFERSTAISALVLSETVFAELLARERRIALDIERDGIPV